MIIITDGRVPATESERMVGDGELSCELDHLDGDHH